MHDFTTRGAPLEYWFVRTGTPDAALAFLVDWIVRRAAGEAEVRVSLWAHGRGRVARAKTGGWRVSRDRVDIRGATFTPTRVTGSVGDVSWELAVDPGAVRLDPVPLAARYLRPFDLQLVARPRARFGGTVTVGGESFSLDDAPGTVSHYWGRRLPDSWVWVSADGLGGGTGLVEAALIRTRMWGAPGGVLGGYVMTCGPEGTRQVVAPAYGRISATGDRTSFELTARAPRRRLRVRAGASADRYNDLGEGIRQTLLGDVEVDGLGALAGGAGLEVRGAPFRTRSRSTLDRSVPATGPD